LDFPFNTVRCLEAFRTKKGIPAAFGAGQIREIKGIVREVLPSGVGISVPLPVARLMIKWSGKAGFYKIGSIFRGKVRLTHKEKDRWFGEILKTY